MTQKNHQALEARRAFFVRHVLDVVEQLEQIFLVARAWACIARRINPRRAVERVHLQAGVVGDRGQCR